MQHETKSARLRSPLILIPVAGLVYADLFLVYLIVQTLVTTGTIDVFTIFYLPFLTVYTLAIVGIWRRPKLGYIATAIASALSLALFGALGNPISALAGPADALSFVFAITLLPSFIAALLYSVLGLREVRKQPTTPTQPTRTIPRYSIGSILILGFVLGGLVIGLMAGATQSRLLANSAPADITILLGAASTSNPQFYDPTTFQARVGQTVTWLNKDTAAHTVTSNANLFDSGNLAIGARYQFTFIQQGTFHYFCSYHSWMPGEVIVS